MQNETVAGLEQTNVFLRPGPRASQELLLLTHLDTVEPGPYGLWTKTQSNPFNASIYGDVLYGLGSADSKLDIACKIQAAKEWLSAKMVHPFVIVGTFGAQSGMTGALRMIRKKMTAAKTALIGEPTGLRIAPGGHGMAIVEVMVPFSAEETAYRKNHDLLESASTQSKFFLGRSAHSSAPSLGDNAIVKMFDYLIQLPSGIAIMDMDGGISHNAVPASAVLEIDMVGGFTDSIVPKISSILQAMRDVEADFKNHPSPIDGSCATLNVGTVRTSDQNIVVRGSCRIPPGNANSVYDKWMEQLKAACHKQGATFCVKDLKLPFTTPPDSEFLQGCNEIMKEMELNSAPVSSPSTTEASVLNRLGVECIVFGPGQSVGNSHEPNERVSMKELDLAVDFYRRVIKRFCL
jgi:succinyl-diaminopimelate desuccinylase